MLHAIDVRCIPGSASSSRRYGFTRTHPASAGEASAAVRRRHLITHRSCRKTARLSRPRRVRGGFEEGEPQDVVADLISKHPERVVLCAQLPPGDPRLPAAETLTRALSMRTFDDGAISLDACLRDFQEVGIGGR